MLTTPERMCSASRPAQTGEASESDVSLLARPVCITQSDSAHRITIFLPSSEREMQTGREEFFNEASSPGGCLFFDIADTVGRRRGG